MTTRAYLALAGALALASAAGSAQAQAVDAAAFVPAAPGTQMFMMYGQYGHQDARYAGGEKIADVDIERYTVMPRYVYFGEVAGRTYNLQILQPFVWAEGSGVSEALGSASGLGDTILTGQLFVHNNPEAGSSVAIEPYLYLPTGDYDADRSLNLGENRWKASFQVGGSKRLSPQFIVEGALDAMIFGDNDDAGGGRRLETDPLYRAQLWGRWQFNPKNETNLRLVYAHGGRTTLDGVARDDRTESLSAMVTWRHNFTPRLNLLTQVGADLSVENGLREDRRFQLRLTRSF